MTRQPKSVLTLLFLLFATISLPAVSQEEENADEDVAEEENSFTDYISMDPPFVTHVGTPGNKPTYLKAAVSLRANSASARPAVDA
ncbi:MAG TPA: flagellar basal body protein FliL, partial [Marinobacter adhaerens]|nr:flagellar basal body protein FliL [Marinobacter adhaerens]